MKSNVSRLKVQMSALPVNKNVKQMVLLVMDVMLAVLAKSFMHFWLCCWCLHFDWIIHIFLDTFFYFY